MVELHSCHSDDLVVEDFSALFEVVLHCDQTGSVALVVVVGAAVLDHSLHCGATAEAEAAATRPAATNDFIFGFEGGLERVTWVSDYSVVKERL